MGKVNEVKGTVLEASVDEKCEGIYLKMLTKEGKIVTFHATTQDQWLKIPEGKDAETELIKTCELLNGYRTDMLGNRVEIPFFVKKELHIIKEDTVK